MIKIPEGTANMNELRRLQSWYTSMCNGDWEHTYGLSISNIDNPGWAFDVDLADSYLFNANFPTQQAQREDENDWYVCEKKAGKFVGRGGPLNLEEILRVFLDWAESVPPLPDKQ